MNDFKFILLPPNSTYLCQPLNVAFFQKICLVLSFGQLKPQEQRGSSQKHFLGVLKREFENVGMYCATNFHSGF